MTNQSTTTKSEELEIIKKIVWGVWMVGPAKAPSWAEDTIEPVEPEEAVDDLESLLAHTRTKALEEAEKVQKANLEQLMAYFFRKMTSNPMIRIGEKRKNWLWGAMCQWCDEFTAKPYKDIKAPEKESDG